MPHDVLPRRDADLLSRVRNLALHVSADAEYYGAAPADAAALQAASDAFAAAVSDPARHSPVSVVAKNTLRATLRGRARQVWRVVGAHAPLSDADRTRVGLGPRRGARAAGPVGAPATRPWLSVDPWGGVRISDLAHPHRRPQPRGVLGAVLMIRIGPDAPAGVADTYYGGLATRHRYALPLPADAEGLLLWVMGCWVNERGDAGAMSDVVSTIIATRGARLGRRAA